MGSIFLIATILSSIAASEAQSAAQSGTNVLGRESLQPVRDSYPQRNQLKGDNEEEENPICEEIDCNPNSPGEYIPLELYFERDQEPKDTVVLPGSNVLFHCSAYTLQAPKDRDVVSSNMTVWRL